MHRGTRNTLQIVAGYLERHNKWLAFGSCGLLAAGAIGWVGGRLIAIPAVEFVSSVLLLAGTVGFTALVFVNKRRFRRPLISQVIGLLSVVWALLVIGLVVAPILRYPMAALMGLIVLLLLAGLRDLIDDAKRWNLTDRRPP